MNQPCREHRVIPQVRSAAALTALLALAAIVSMETSSASGSVRPAKRSLGLASAIELFGLDGSGTIRIDANSQNTSNVELADDQQATIHAGGPRHLRQHSASGTAATTRWIQLQLNLPPPTMQI